MIIGDALDLNAPFRLERRRLIEHITNQNYAYLITHQEEPLTTEQEQYYLHLFQRLLTGEPLAYVLGYQEFYGLRFQVSTDVLIPRADTELLIDQALPILSNQPHPHCLDLGTGSGIIAITLKRFMSHIKMTGADYSPQALALAKHNANSLLTNDCHPIQWIESNWFNHITDRYDFIFSNPPYIADHDPHLKQEGLPFEPLLALTSGEKGLDALETIIHQAPDYLRPSGYIFLEHGYDQQHAVQTLMQQAGFSEIHTFLDLNQLPRLTRGVLS